MSGHATAMMPQTKLYWGITNDINKAKPQTAAMTRFTFIPSR